LVPSRRVRLTRLARLGRVVLLDRAAQVIEAAGTAEGPEGPEAARGAEETGRLRGSLRSAGPACRLSFREPDSRLRSRPGDSGCSHSRQQHFFGGASGSIPLSTLSLDLVGGGDPLVRCAHRTRAASRAPRSGQGSGSDGSQESVSTVPGCTGPRPSTSPAASFSSSWNRLHLAWRAERAVEVAGGSSPSRARWCSPNGCVTSGRSADCLWAGWHWAKQLGPLCSRRGSGGRCC